MSDSKVDALLENERMVCRARRDFLKTLALGAGGLAVGPLFPRPAGAIDPATLQEIPMETRWTSVARSYTWLDTMCAKALFDGVGREKMEEIQKNIYTMAGKYCKRRADALSLSAEDAKGAAEAMQVLKTISNGPDTKIETVDATAERAVVRCLECPFANRRKEMGIKDDLCSVFSQAWWDNGVKSLNPKLIATLTKAMPWGDRYCEFVIELQA